MADPESERTLVNLRLFPAEFEALKKAAKSEDRSLAAMARRLVCGELRRVGMLPEDAPAESAEPEAA